MSARSRIPPAAVLAAALTACPQLGPEAVCLPRARADETAAGLFERAAEVLAARCLACHQGVTARGHLDLSTRETLLTGGDSGPAVVAGDPEQSLLMEMVAGDAPAMPDEGESLSPAELAALRGWIAAGVPWTSKVPLEPRREAAWWSFANLSRPEVPRPMGAPPPGWPRNAIDSFVLARLREQGLEPSPEADRRTLIRRLSYDLHGLPPSREAIQDFLADTAEAAYERLVERLLASPRYGERWGRHWLDVAHYADTHGYDKDKRRDHAWPYRDWVIAALNDDLPYGAFVARQLAADALDPDDPSAVVATGFVAAGPWDFVGHVELAEDSLEKRKTRWIDRDDMVANALSSFSSLTVHCARCHDHPYDPITQREYYALQAVFAGVDRGDRAFDRDPAVAQARARLADLADPLLRRREQLERAAAEVQGPELEALDRQLAALRARREAGGAAPAPDAAANPVDRPAAAGEPAPRPGAEQPPGSPEDLARAIAALEEERARVAESLLPAELKHQRAATLEALADLERKRAALAPEEKVYALVSQPPRAIHVYPRGDVERPGDEVGPGALAAVAGLSPEFDLEADALDQARRGALAGWLADPRNALTWRSIANRVWHYHFGRGLVDTPNDFGRGGSLPTHPELLDWLAGELLARGQSLKALHRLIVNSATYRQAWRNDPRAEAADGENRFLWRAPRRRLEAEAVRDAVLAVAGSLDLTMGGPGVELFEFEDDHSPRYRYPVVEGPRHWRRTVYRFVVRSVPNPLLETLDCPDPSLAAPVRTATITPLQALALLNNPFMIQQAELLAARAAAAAGGAQPRVEWLVETLFARLPEPREQAELAAFAESHGWPALCRLLLNSNEFVFVD